jgi:homoserine kinase
VKRFPARLDARLVNRIPLSSGMGSSAAATIGGLVAANELTGRAFSNEELLAMAAGMEGHPDNVAPALYGGLTICAQDAKKKVHVLCPRVRNDLTFIFCVPDRMLPTQQARQVLPKSYSREDVVFNISRTALLAALLQGGDAALLDLAMQDRIHQPYRAPLVPGLAETIEAARGAGAMGACFSGSGPTILAISDRRGNHEKIAQAMKAAFRRHAIASDVFPLRVSRFGARVTRA